MCVFNVLFSCHILSGSVLVLPFSACQCPMSASLVVCHLTGWRVSPSPGLQKHALVIFFFGGLEEVVCVWYLVCLISGVCAVAAIKWAPLPGGSEPSFLVARTPLKAKGNWRKEQESFISLKNNSGAAPCCKRGIMFHAADMSLCNIEDGSGCSGALPFPSWPVMSKSLRRNTSS